MASSGGVPKALMLCSVLRKALNNWKMLRGAAGRRWSLQPVQRMLDGAGRFDDNLWGECDRACECGGRGLGSLAPNGQFSQVGLREAAQFLQGIVLRQGEPANVGSQQAQRDSLMVWRC